MPEMDRYPRPYGAVDYADEIADAFESIIEGQKTVLGLTTVERYRPQAEQWTARNYKKAALPACSVAVESKGSDGWPATRTLRLLYDLHLGVVVSNGVLRTGRETHERIRENLIALVMSSQCHGQWVLNRSQVNLWADSASLGDVQKPAGGILGGVVSSDNVIRIMVDTPDPIVG